MQKKASLSETGMAAAAALIMVAATFVIPLLIFCSAGRAEAAQREVLPAVPAPVSPPVSFPPGSPLPSASEGLEGIGELDSERTVKVLLADGSVAEWSMAEYLWGVVAAEMPASFELEALKAQAAAARTYTLWKSVHSTGSHPEADVCTDYSCCQAWISRENAEVNWGEKSEEYSGRIRQAVSATDGEFVTYDGAPIQAVYHSSSAGRTEDAVAVWGSTVPYLVSAVTPEGEEVPNYHTTVVLTAEEVRAALEALGCDLAQPPSEWFGQLTRTECGGVRTAVIGGITLRGSTLRTALGLRSPVFDVEYNSGGFTFSVTGYGHGVGMSQYGANALAKGGKTWREIIQWYYKGVEIKRYGES